MQWAQTSGAAPGVIDNAFHSVRRRRFSRRSDAVVDEYARLARVYDRRWAAYVAATVEHSLRRLPGGDYRRALDVGCGTGAFLAALAARLPGVRLVGVDLSSSMLTAASAKRVASATLCRARAEALPFAGGDFDLAVSLSAFHDFDDLGRAMQEIYRVLRPGGTVLVTDWCGDYLASRLFGRLATLRRGADFTVPDARHWRSLLVKAGFRGVRVERYRTSGFWGLMTAGALKPE